MRGTKKIRQTAKALLQFSMKEDEVSSEQVKAVLQALEANPPRNFKAVLREYLRLVRREIERSQAKVEYAGELSTEAVNSIEASLSAQYGRPITAAPEQNNSLIAGWRIRVGSDVFDSSILNRLHLLAKSTAR